MSRAASAGAAPSPGASQRAPRGAAFRRYLGLDLTDPYAAAPRPVDIALLSPDARCSFATLPVFTVGMSVRSWLAPIEAAPDAGDLLLIDGPLALARPGATLRDCERRVAAAGKTPDRLAPDFAPGSPERRRPFAGFVRGSLELAQALRLAGWSPFTAAAASSLSTATSGIAPPALEPLPSDLETSGHPHHGAPAPGLALEGPPRDVALLDATLLEVYPGGSWRRLAGRALPPKATAAGRRERTALLSDLGLRFERPPETHDQLDAALCAWLGWQLHLGNPRIEPLGLPCFFEAGALREGTILQVAAQGRTRSADRASTSDTSSTSSLAARPARNG